MREFLSALPNTFIPLFVAMGIISVLPIFMAITDGFAEKEKNTVIRQSIITALLVSLLFTAVGEAIFRVIGITVSDFKVAGGLVLLVFAVLDLTREGKRPVPSETVGVVPLGVPLIVGPAVLTTILVLVDHYGIAPTVASLVLNLFIAWLFLRGAGRIVKFLGKNGIVAISKVMALLLGAIAVMMIRLGLEGILSGR